MKLFLGQGDENGALVLGGELPVSARRVKTFQSPANKRLAQAYATSRDAIAAAAGSGVSGGGVTGGGGNAPGGRQQ